MRIRNQKSEIKTFFLTFGSCILALASIHAQQSTTVGASVSSIDTSKIDTNYVKFYKDKLILALWQSERSFDILLAPNPKMISASGDTINYIANSNHVTGISLDYDILSVAFGFRSVPSGSTRTGSTDYFDLGANINTRGFRFENSYKRYTGFYDKNTPKYVQPFNDSTPYFQNPSLNIQVIKSKLIYSISNKRFSLSGAYANVKRQVKSAGSVLLVYNFYALSMYSDSSMIPVPLQKYYGTVWDGLYKMNIYAYSAGAGLTRTFVFWKKFYLNFLFAMGYERQYRHYYIYPENTHYSYWKTWFAGDWRTSIGWNGKRFFIRATSIYDLNNYESKDLIFKMKFFASSFDFGYRFKFRAPRPYRKFQETKVYKML